MAEPKKSNVIMLSEKHDSLFKLYALGYDDFRVVEKLKFFREFNWSSLHFVRNGKGHLFIGEKKYEINAGDFFLIPCNVSAMYYADDDDPWRYYWISFAEDSLFDINLNFHLSSQNPVGSAKSPKLLTSLFDSLFENSYSSAELYYETMSVLMKILGSEHIQNSDEIHGLSHNEIISKAKNIIESNFARPDFSVSNIARVLYLSHQHLERLFKKETGTTLVSYLSELRLSNAEKLLHERAYSIKELCECCGFENEAYFMRRFKKRYGMPVKEYRKNIIRKRMNCQTKCNT